MIGTEKMNVEICQKCKAKPYLSAYYSGERGMAVFHRGIVCLNTPQGISAVAYLNDKTFDTLVNKLLGGRVLLEVERNPLDLDKLKKEKIVGQIRINKPCPYCLEHRLHDWNNEYEQSNMS